MTKLPPLCKTMSRVGDQSSIFLTAQYHHMLFVILADILSTERKRLHRRKSMDPRNKCQITDEKRAVNLSEWQQRQVAKKKAATHRLIPNSKKWVSRETGVVVYIITNLTTCGCFRSYLLSFKRVESSEFFLGQMKHLNRTGIAITPENVVDYMLGNNFIIKLYITFIIRFNNRVECTCSVSNDYCNCHL